MRFRRQESQEHKDAKARVAEWMAEAAAAGDWGLSATARAFLEWPLVVDAPTEVWNHPPSYRKLRAARRTVAAILDLCVVDAGAIIVGIEICNWHRVPAHKALFLQRLPFPVCELDSSWVLTQPARPESWQFLARFGEGA